ncbi:AI-2E family transporter [Solilutibacter silvestris]|uniref:Putative permease n=1 Tax=Solilutibacter silvestris TaxID=1645665 RepID=A0A2K1Q2V6_9GAMM|nr:AI-2E family transporter [Lysobacter silvestris]PNS09386.1 putative permease [Lysobacter silvestris]
MNTDSPRASLAGIAAFYQRVQFATLALAVLWLLSHLASVLVPFLVALLLAWLGDPFVRRLQARKLSRNLAVVLVYLGMLLIVVIAALVLVPLIERQIATLIAAFPRYRDWFLATAIPWIEHRFNVQLSDWLDTGRITAWLEDHWKQAGGYAGTVLGVVSRSGFRMLGWAVNLVLIPILTFFFLRDWDDIVRRITALVPRDHADLAQRLAKESSDVLRSFLRGQLLVMLILAILYAVGLRVAGLELGILIGMLAGLCSFVPYLGPIVLLLLGCGAALAQYGDWHYLIGVFVVYGVGQLLESYVLTPKLVGKSIGLGEVSVIFAVMAGEALFGFLGMLLALPVAAVGNVLMRHVYQTYLASSLYRGDEPAQSQLIVPGSIIDETHGNSDVPG